MSRMSTAEARGGRTEQEQPSAEQWIMKGVEDELE